MSEILLKKLASVSLRLCFWRRGRSSSKTGQSSIGADFLWFTSETGSIHLVGLRHGYPSFRFTTFQMIFYLFHLFVLSNYWWVRICPNWIYILIWIVSVRVSVKSCQVFLYLSTLVNYPDSRQISSDLVRSRPISSEWNIFARNGMFLHWMEYSCKEWNILARNGIILYKNECVAVFSIFEPI